MMKILLLKTWLTNIGNGFIDMGARICLERSFPNAEIIEVSGYANYVMDEYSLWSFNNVIKRKLMNKNYPSFDIMNAKNSIDISEFIDLDEIDVAVMAGCVLYEHALRKYTKTFMLLKEKEIPLILLGAGGGDYSKETQRYVNKFIDKIKPFALLTRDSTSYELYSKRFTFSYDGIDCAFFIDEWYKPPVSNKSFIVATFDKVREPHLHTDKDIIRLTHTPFGHPSKRWMHTIHLLLRRLPTHISLNKLNIFFSDDIKDYLFFYANAEEVHSDRVHACVASLVYGNKAKLYYKTPRASLFSKVINRDILKELVTIDKDKLHEEKSSQISAIKESIEMAI